MKPSLPGKTFCGSLPGCSAAGSADRTCRAQPLQKVIPGTRAPLEGAARSGLAGEAPRSGAPPRCLLLW